MLCLSRTCNSDRFVDHRHLRVRARVWAEGYQLLPGRGQQRGLAHPVGVDAAPLPQRTLQMHPSTRVARMADMVVRRRLSPCHRCLSVHLGRVCCGSPAQGASLASLVGRGLDWTGRHHWCMMGQTPRVWAGAMVSATTRNAVWQELLDAARFVRYYGELADRHRRKRWTIQFLLMVAATSGVAALLDPLPAFIHQVAAAAVAILVVWDFFGDYARKAAVLDVVRAECTRVENQLVTLWLEIDAIEAEDSDVLRQCNTLRQRLSDATDKPGQVGVTVKAKLNETCTVDAYKVVEERYAT